MYVLIAFACGTTGLVDYVVKYRIEFYPYGYISASFLLFFIALAITKTELMDIKVAITKTVAYGIVAVALVATFVWLNSLTMSMIVAMAANSVLALFWAMAAHRIRGFIQTPLEEKWITDFYDSDKLINSIVNKLLPAFERAEAFKIIVDELKNRIKIKRISVLLGEKEHQAEPVKYVLQAEEGEPKEIEANHPLIKYIKEKHDVLAFANLNVQLKSALKEYTYLRNSILLPIFSSESLEGIIVIGQKKSEDSYSDKDITLFRTVMSQTLVVLDRVRPYEKIRLELDKAERELARSQRLASLGTLTAGVTHEIRNPLAVIRSETERLVNKPRSQEELNTYQEMMMKHIDRITGIVERMLNLAKDKTKNKIDISIDETISGVLPFFKLNNVKLTQDLQKVPGIKADQEEMQEVFVNLIQNALDAMPEGGQLTVKTYAKDNRVIAEVTDTGKGIPAELKEKIFDPFFSSRHEGVGLGLSIVYKIVREHGGDIQVESEAGRGATFRVLF